MLGATSRESCAGAPRGVGWSSSSGWHWPAPSSSVVGWSAAPGPTIAGTAAHTIAHDRLLAQALSDNPSQGRGRQLPLGVVKPIRCVGGGPYRSRESLLSDSVWSSWI